MSSKALCALLFKAPHWKSSQRSILPTLHCDLGVVYYRINGGSLVPCYLFLYMPVCTSCITLKCEHSWTLTSRRPVKVFWDLHPNYPYKCNNLSMFFLASGCINTITDILCTMLPALIVAKLQLPTKRKIGVASVFLVGIVVNIASILRIYYSFVQARTGDGMYLLHHFKVWTFMNADIP